MTWLAFVGGMFVGGMLVGMVAIWLLSEMDRPDTSAKAMAERNCGRTR